MVYCVYSLESPKGGDSNEYTQHIFMLKKIEKISLLCRLTWLHYQHHWLKLTLSRINFHGPKGVRAIEVLLYSVVSGESYKTGRKSVNQTDPYIFNRHLQSRLGENRLCSVLFIRIIFLRWFIFIQIFIWHTKYYGGYLIFLLNTCTVDSRYLEVKGTL